MNTLYEVKDIQPNNRGLFTLKPFKTSQKVMQCEPLASATLKTMKGNICNWCLMKKELFRW
jgi:hypothetical protein